ncbi:MAG: type III-A CRISPR-associated RAMP protein Csm4 [Acidobacteriota bacterium]
MNPGFLVQLRPSGPWRIGPATGARDRVDRIFHSDTLFSAVSHAMARLGRLEEWFAATVASPNGPAVRLSSLFPSLGELRFVPPPKNLWPPPPSAKVRWSNARFVPLSAVRDLVSEKPLNDNRWALDGASGCLLPADAQFHSGPFRTALRSHAAVDRLRGDAIAVHRTACLEFSEGGGFWGAVSFAGDAAREQWSGPLQAAFRYLADTGVGGERSLGWGRSRQPEFTEGVLPDLILPPPEEPAETAYWLLSLFSPAPGDAVDWQRGAYGIAERSGRIESPERSGEEKKTARMIEEGSVLAAAAPPTGAAPDVAPGGFPHPVYRSGFALAVPVPLKGAA